MTGMKSRFGLDRQGMHHLGTEHWNQTAPVLYEHAVRRGEGELAFGGSFSANTGAFTGRTPRDKYIVEEPGTKDTVWWGKINQPVAPERFASLHQRMLAYLQGRELFVQDLYAGADPQYRLPVRVVTDSAWHSLFSRNMFIRPPVDELAGFEPAFTILHAPKFLAIPEQDRINSETFIFVNFAEKLVLIGGTAYAGEIKKSVFGYLNFVLPARGVCRCTPRPMSARKATARFSSGSPGPARRRLSADSSRTLIGDDEHGWSPRGIFNFEGGCYAKVINLSPTAEPEIYATITRFGTVLENVVLDPETRMPDVDDASLTENTRACYPIDFIPNADPQGPGAASEECRDADRRRLRGHAADRQDDRRAGDVSFPVGLHGARRRHREGAQQRARGDLLDLLRRPLHAAPPGGLRQDAGRADQRARRAVLARQHRLVGRHLWGRPAHADRPYPGLAARRARRPARRGAGAQGREFRPLGAGKLPRGPERGARPARHLVRQEGL